MEAAMQRIVTYLWFDTQAEEAATFYTSLFPNSRITEVMNANGAVMGVNFELEGQEFIALNGGPEFNFTEAISLYVKCERQEEIDRLWNALTADGGEEGNCGWLKDKYGLSWQIIPTQLGVLLSNPDPAQAQRSMQAMLQMKKLDIQALQDA
jgi:predicted 3-demethylubiquinone-9 3-methyltransferase (glyoxalase superfamily)